MPTLEFKGKQHIYARHLTICTDLVILKITYS